MNTIGISPNASVEVRRIDDDNVCVVVDDFLNDPHALVEFATAHADDFEMQEGMDIDPDASRSLKRILGIPDNYYVEVPEDVSLHGCTQGVGPSKVARPLI